MPANIRFRPGTIEDSYTSFTVFELAIADLIKRMGLGGSSSADDPEALARMWGERRSLYEHLARTANRFWIAEADEQVIGFSRSILRDDHEELTELFVLPGQQSTGVGRELLSRALSSSCEKGRSIIASPDARALVLYIKTGVYPLFSLYYLGRKPEKVTITTDLTIRPLSASPEELEITGRLDERLLGHRRTVDHQWLVADRKGYLYLRDNEPVGYGYVGRWSGPFLLLDEDDFPAVLAHAESAAAEGGQERFGLEIPAINHAALDYLVSRKFKLDSFVATYMSDSAADSLKNYIVTSPPFFL